MTAYVVLALLAGLGLGAPILRPRTGTGVGWLAGLALVYAGQRLFGGAEGEGLLTWSGVAVAAANLGLRARAMLAAEGAQAATQRSALLAQLLGSSSLGLWYLSTPGVSEALGLTGEALDRWTVPLQALVPIALLAGAAPTLLLDQVLGAHPHLMPEGARRQAVGSGLALAFGLALVFPVNYLANEHDADWDYSYFRVTRPGSSTLALVANLDEPIEALLFYAPASDVKEQMLPYFEEVAAASGGKFTVRVVDQPAEPELSKELSIRDNGYVVLRQGEATQKVRIDTDLGKARRELKKLDGTIQKHLLKLAKGKRVAYLYTDHGEASPRETSPLFKLSLFKQALQGQNFDVKDFGLELGSADEVPEDAAFVVLAAPQKAMLPEEIAALKAYLDKGGAALVYADAGRDGMADVLGHLGVKLTASPLAHTGKYIRMTGGVSDRGNLFSQRFGSHAATSTLSKYATRAAVFLPTVVGLEETGTQSAPGPAKHTPLVRSYEDTWEDVDGDFERSPQEAAKVHVLAMAVQGPDTAPYRVIVTGDVSTVSDPALQQIEGNAIFLLDSVRWLVGEEDLAGEISSEEDVKIEHTREQDVAWFYGIIFGVPALVLVVGALFVRRRTAASA